MAYISILSAAIPTVSESSCVSETKEARLIRADWYFEDATVQSAIALTRELMEKYSIPADHVIRHYDVTGKICPNPHVYNHTKHTWEAFKVALAASETAVVG